MEFIYFVGLTAALIAGFLIGALVVGGCKYDGSIGLEQQDDGRYAVVLNYNLDELYSKKKRCITLEVLEDRTNPTVNNSEDSNKKEDNNNETF